VAACWLRPADDDGSAGRSWHPPHVTNQTFLPLPRPPGPPSCSTAIETNNNDDNDNALPDMPDSPPPEERAKLDAEAKAREDAEQAALPYKWTQTIQDLDVTIAVDGKYKGRDLDVKITKTHLRVAVKGQEPIIDVRTHTLVA
jgi:hypothetical protein